MNEESLKHYYGDKIRALFVIGGMLMAITYPIFNKLVEIPLPVAILGCILLAVFGGLMNPQQKWVIALSVLISVIAFGVFEYHAVTTYVGATYKDNSYTLFFWVNQILAMIFFFAAYLSTKTFRGLILAEKKLKE